MKKQISRLSPNRNGIVVGVVTAILSLVFVIPMLAIMFHFGPNVGPHGEPTMMPKFIFLLAPIFYFVFGYVGTALACLIYNLLFKLIGGFEFEVIDKARA